MDKSTLLKLYRSMVRIRLFEEKIIECYPKQEIKCPVHLCIGQEAIAAGVIAHLKKEDVVVSNHRGHGHCIAKGMLMKLIMAELYGKESGCSLGRGGSMHLVDAENGILGTTAIVGGCIPIATGSALSFKYLNKDNVSVCFFGDGAVEEGVFHESLMFASLHKLPILYVCENNYYATHSPISSRQPHENIYKYAEAYEIPGVCADGNDVQEVYNKSKNAIERAKNGKGPTLLEAKTYRWKTHVGPEEDKDFGFRTTKELELWKKRCPIKKTEKKLIDEFNFERKEFDLIKEEAVKEIDKALEYALGSSFPKKESICDFVYAE